MSRCHLESSSTKSSKVFHFDAFLDNVVSHFRHQCKLQEMRANETSIETLLKSFVLLFWKNKESNTKDHNVAL